VSAPFPPAVYVVGAAALTPFGLGWRGLAARAAANEPPARTEVPALAPDDDPCEPRRRKMMSRAAYLAAAAVRAALRVPAVAALGVRPADTGLFLGVGASGGEIPELEAMLRESVAGDAFQLGRFGDAGLRAANPLFAFQLMNNFTLCHGAILAGLEGPSAAFFSRGAGTVRALREAAFAVAEGEAPVALAGGADSALYPVTTFELGRSGPPVRPSEGAAVLALVPGSVEATSVRLVRAEVAPSFSLEARRGERGPSLVVVTASDPAARASIAADARAQETEIVVVDEVLGETLAAAPALAWAVAFDWLAARPQGRACVLSRGLDGELGVVELAKGAT
jgi:hypothetical protein